MSAKSSNGWVIERTTGWIKTYYTGTIFSILSDAVVAGHPNKYHSIELAKLERILAYLIAETQGTYALVEVVVSGDEIALLKPTPEQLKSLAYFELIKRP